MYEILKEYTYDDAIGFTFYKKVIFDYDSEERYFCLTVKSCDCGDDENILLDFIYDSEEFEEEAQTTICEYLLKQIRDLAYIETLFLTIRNKGEKATIEILKDGIKFGNKIFRLKNNDYHALQHQLLDYISDLKNNVNNQ